MALTMLPDWLLKFQKSVAIQLQAIRLGFVPKILLSLQEEMSLNYFLCYIISL